MAPDGLMRHAVLALAAGDLEVSEYYRREADRAGWREEATKVALLSRERLPDLDLYPEARGQVAANPHPPGSVEAIMDKLEARRNGECAERARFVDGAMFILDAPATPPAVWGDEEQVLWSEGEPLLVAGPAGVGKTTISTQLVAASIGLLD